MAVRRRVDPHQILAACPAAVATLADELRQIVIEGVPEAAEAGYPGWHAIGYRHPEAGYFCGIFPAEDHVKLLFEQGRYLPDPAALLRGDGRQTRYVPIRDATDIQLVPLRALLAESIALGASLRGAKKVPARR